MGVDDQPARIACLLTAPGNRAHLEAAAAAFGEGAARLVFALREDLLARAEAEGGLTEAIEAETADALAALAAEADAVLLTCSTLGPAAPRAAAKVATPVLRIDAALAEAAVEAAAGGRLAVLCAVETTVAPTTALFEAARRESGVTLDTRLVEGAWALLKSGDAEGYRRRTAEAADAAIAEGADAVALAQASMTGAERLVRAGKPVLASPPAGVAAAIKAAEHARSQARCGVDAARSLERDDA